jgi:hypothetical protein
VRSQLGIAKEVTWGTYVAPTRFLEFVSETLARNKRTITSQGIRASADRQLQRSSRRVVTGRDGSGQFTIELPYDGIVALLEACLGSVTTAQPDAVNAPTVYQHTFTLGSLLGKSLTIQKGVERNDGTVIPFSFVGSKVSSWELSVAANEFARLATTIDAQDVQTAPTLVPATFDDGNLAHFQQAALKRDGITLAAITSASVTGTNPMRTERYYLGNAGLKAEQTDQGYPTVGGSFSADFVSDGDLVAAYDDDASLEIELSFVGDVIEGAFDESLTVTIGDVRLDGETPKVSGTDLPTLTIPWSGLHPNAGAALSAVLVNADAGA